MDENEKTKSYELKPCPFCGGEAKMQIGGLGLFSTDKCASVICRHCNACGPVVKISLDYSATKEAADAWNNRDINRRNKENINYFKKSDGNNPFITIIDEFSTMQDKTKETNNEGEKL